MSKLSDFDVIRAKIVHLGRIADTLKVIGDRNDDEMQNCMRFLSEQLMDGLGTMDYVLTQIEMELEGKHD